MDPTKLAAFLTDPHRTTPLFRKRLKEAPKVTLKNSGLSDAEITALIVALGNVKRPLLTPQEQQEAQLTFQKITLTWSSGGITAEDNWLAGGV